MKAWKICYDVEEHQGSIATGSCIVSNREIAYAVAECLNCDEVRIFPVDIKVKYRWSKEFDDR